MTMYPRAFKNKFLKEYLRVGSVTKTCKTFSIPRSTFYLWVEKDKRFRESLEKLRNEIEEINLDECEDVHRILRRGLPKYESKVIDGKEQLVQTGWEERPDRAAVEFYLTKKGKKRGYAESIEVTGKDGKPLVEKLTDEEIDSRLLRLTKIVKIGES